MNIQTLHPNPAQLESERLRPPPEVSDTAANAVTGPNEAPGVTAAAKAAGSDEGGLRGELRDRYAPEDRSGKAGLYRMAKDEEGNPVLLFDGPEKATQEKTEAAGESEEAEAEEKAAAQKEAAQEKEAEESESKSTVTNTDRVDRELQQLRDEAEDLARKLRTATGDEAERLQQKLTLAKIELRIKDNDTYRRAHAQVTVE